MGKNDLVLPQGAECDACNSYLGKLDRVLAKHPLVALGAQMLRIPGKRGRLRRVIGTVSLNAADRTVSIPVRSKDTSTSSGRAVRFTSLIDPKFDDFRFRRALHHVGLNVLAYQRGVEVAHEQRFDLVRRYVRRPSPRERWGFGQMPLFKGMSSDILLVLVPDASMVTIGMRLFGAIFYVDLLNSGRLPAWIEKERVGYPDLQYWGPEAGVPAALRWNGKREEEVWIDI